MDTVRRLSGKYHANTDVVSLLLDTLTEEDVEEILSMHPIDLIQTARVNLLRTSRETAIQLLQKEGIRALPLEEIPEGIEIIHGAEDLGHSIVYLTGLVMPQGLGSMIAVHALDPQPNELVLDLAAAPGNKTAFIAERMRNTGTIVANDKSKPRLQSIISNLNRLGITNVAITNYDGSAFPTTEKYDRILLDAPCTGEGLVVSQPSRRRSREMLDPYILQRTQQRLFKRALRLLKKGGILVYSTCSISSIENEDAVLPFMRNTSIEPIYVNSPAPFMESEKLSGAIRLLPNTHGCDGFFVLKVKKL